MGRVMRSCIQSILKLVNTVIGMVGLAMIMYGVWLIRTWQREMGDSPFDDDSDHPAPYEATTELQRNSAVWDKVVGEIVKIERKIFPKHESLAKSFDEELRRKNSGLLYIEKDGEVVGYVMYSWPSSLYASITKLAVKENHRRQGYGEALLKAATEKCRTRKVLRISLHVDPLRTPAISLYKKLGFQIDDLVEAYYSTDRNAYRMYLDFDSDQ